VQPFSFFVTRYTRVETRVYTHTEKTLHWFWTSILFRRRKRPAGNRIHENLSRERIYFIKVSIKTESCKIKRL